MSNAGGSYSVLLLLWCGQLISLHVVLIAYYQHREASNGHSLLEEKKKKKNFSYNYYRDQVKNSRTVNLSIASNYFYINERGKRVNNKTI